MDQYRERVWSVKPALLGRFRASGRVEVSRQAPNRLEKRMESASGSYGERLITRKRAGTEA